VLNAGGFAYDSTGSGMMGGIMSGPRAGERMYFFSNHTRI